MSQKSTACSATSSRLQCGASLVSLGSSPFIAQPLDLPTIWMFPSGHPSVAAAEVEVVDAERLLEDRVVALLGQRHDGLRVVEHVVPTHLVGAVGQAVGVLVVGRLGAGAWRCWTPRRTPRRCRRGSAPRSPARDTTTPVTLPPPAIGLEPHDLRLDEQRHVRRHQQRPHGDRLGIGLGVHQARIAVAPRAADARAPGPVGLVEQDPARRRERVVAPGGRGRRRSPGSAARGRRPATGTASTSAPRSDPHRGCRAPGRATRPSCTRARTRRSSRARPVRRRRRA